MKIKFGCSSFDHDGVKNTSVHVYVWDGDKCLAAVQVPQMVTDESKTFAVAMDAITIACGIKVLMKALGHDMPDDKMSFIDINRDIRKEFLG